MAPEPLKSCLVGLTFFASFDFHQRSRELNTRTAAPGQGIHIQGWAGPLPILTSPGDICKNETGSRTAQKLPGWLNFFCLIRCTLGDSCMGKHYLKIQIFTKVSCFFEVVQSKNEVANRWCFCATWARVIYNFGCLSVKN